MKVWEVTNEKPYCSGLEKIMKAYKNGQLKAYGNLIFGFFTIQIVN